YFFFSSRRRHTRSKRDWSSDVCSSDLIAKEKIITRFIKAYQEYRRNGQLKHAHHVLLMLQSYDPENQFAHDILTSLTFQGYQVRSEERRVGEECRSP